MSKTIVFSCCLLMGLVIVFVAIRASQKNKFQLTSNDVKQDELLKTDQVYFVSTAVPLTLSNNA